MVPPLDQGSLIAGHRGLDRELLWVDIMHTPAERFVLPGYLVLTTGADVHQPGVREFLSYLIQSPAAGVVLSPPPDVRLQDLLISLVPLADENRFPVIFLPWELRFSDVTRNLMPRLSPDVPKSQVELAVGRSAVDGWDEAGAQELSRHVIDEAEQRGLQVEASVAPGVVIFTFRPPQTSATVSELLAFSGDRSDAFSETASWVFFGPQAGDSGSDFFPAVRPKKSGHFLEALREHPASMFFVARTLQPLVDYDSSRGGDLVHTLEVLFDESLNTSAAARRLYLNRHSLLYRVQLIEKLTGCSLKSVEDRFNLEVSVRVHLFRPR